MVDVKTMMEELKERAQRASQSWRPGARVVSVEPLTGGASSLTFTTRFEGVDPLDEIVVLKVAPPGLPPVRNRDVLRQSVLMRALAGRDGVLVPDTLFEDAGDPPEIPPFLAMNLVPGECLEPMLVSDPDPRRFGEFRARAFDAARVLAAIHRLEPAAVGITEEPVSVKAEIDRWVRAYETSPRHLQFNYTEVADALYASIPEAVSPVINHGDYRLGNTLCTGDRLNAVIDWEIWSVGDPRVDLTWFTFFCDDSGHPSKASDGPSGIPSRAELRGAYVDAGGEAFPDLDWFYALTYFKEAALTSLLVKRAEKSDDRVLKQRLVSFTPSLGRLLDMATAVLSSL
jgi:aminoglycoside phosphotransferase (APT) family kinase protein